MKAILLTGIRSLRLDDVPDPRIERDTDVRVRVGAVGVCGSDIHYYVDGRIGRQVVEYPFTVGHEGAGTVEDVGRAVTRVKPGDRVAVDPAMPCWECDQCRAGRQNTCRKLRFLGCPGEAAGCLSEYIVVPETSCFPVPDALSLEEAAFSEPLSIGVYAARKAGFGPGAALGILGAGPIGLSVLLAARARGAARVHVTDKVNARLEVASRLGATGTANPDREDVVRRIGESEPHQLDAVFECCGDQDALDEGIELLKPGGKLMILGIPALTRVSFDVDATRRKEVCIQHVRRQLDCVEEAIEGIARKDFVVSPLLTHRYGPGEAEEAFQLVAEYRDGVVKAVIGF